MAGVLESVRDYAHHHPTSLATGLIIALPGTYFLITGRSIPCATPGVETLAKTAGLCQESDSPAYSPAATIQRALSVYHSQHPIDLRLHLPESRWADNSSTAFISRILTGTSRNINALITEAGNYLRLDLDQLSRMLEGRWSQHYDLHRFASVAISTALPGIFLTFARNHPDSWAARHQTEVANALHVLALITVANQRLSVQDVIVTALVMVSFEALRRSYGLTTTPRSAIETLLSSTHSVVAESDIVKPPNGSVVENEYGVASRNFALVDAKEEELTQLRKELVVAKTSDKSKDNELKRTEDDLHHARQTLTETFSEYSTLRDEMKTIKTTIGRDHQAIIYRKDIELFALRKSNEQKENYIKERDAKFDDLHRQHKAVLDVKESQIQSLKDRVAQLEGQQMTPFAEQETPGETTPQTAVQVKLLRVSGRTSLELDASPAEKDAEIARLKAELGDVQKASLETLPRVQDELRRAWDASSEVLNALNDERRQHKQTQDKLREAVLRLEEEARASSQINSPARLPTIQEQDRTELEVMFNATQQDNLRLYSELEAADKRAREADALVSTNEQELNSLKEQLRLEKAINEDMENARPSLVHRVHYQRMEGQLKEASIQLATKDEEIQGLQKAATSRVSEADDIRKEKEAAEQAKAQAVEENEQLKKSVAELESTKEQLMLDHERLAKHRTRERTTSSDHASARSSGATLITEPTFHTSDVPLPERPVTIAGETSTISGTPETNRFSMILNDVPPPELRSGKRKSLTLKGLMKKMVRKDHDQNEQPTNGDPSNGESKIERPKTALAPKDKNAALRPKTAVDKKGKKDVDRPKTAAPHKEDARPKTSAPQTTTKPGMAKGQEKDDGNRPKSRGWSTSRKLVRKSVILQ
ncbi:hypothetical protein BDV96DRAFT_361291 [Lophiotrema nucula]|uniref:Uncharacterized protein n=1 Tax=Lophiotrema nucula TaxID=690887 RepID=A0A6A5ZHN3_9PLEO|nr:hypothetical protein BDV96DRAFT_361291 [Lophiotrema nucula]